MHMIDVWDTRLGDDVIDGVRRNEIPAVRIPRAGNSATRPKYDDSLGHSVSAQRRDEPGRRLFDLKKRRGILVIHASQVSGHFRHVCNIVAYP